MHLLRNFFLFSILLTSIKSHGQKIFDLDLYLSQSIPFGNNVEDKFGSLPALNANVNYLFVGRASLGTSLRINNFGVEPEGRRIKINNAYFFSLNEEIRYTFFAMQKSSIYASVEGGYSILKYYDASDWLNFYFTRYAFNYSYGLGLRKQLNNGKYDCLFETSYTTMLDKFGGHKNPYPNNTFRYLTFRVGLSFNYTKQNYINY